jgi:hypothetical protein
VRKRVLIILLVCNVSKAGNCKMEGKKREETTAGTSKQKQHQAI